MSLNTRNLQQIDPLLTEITQRLRERLPEATTIIFFGSRVTGLADEFSDYDVMVLLPDGLEREDRLAIEREMGKEFPSLKLDLLFGSERSLLYSLPYEPYRRFWLENGIVTWGKKPLVKKYPPLAKGALDSHLNIIKSQIDLARVLDDSHQSAQCCFSALKMLLLIEKALQNQHSSQIVQSGLENLVGVELIEKIRDPRSELGRKDLRRLFKKTIDKYRQMKGIVDNMAENESDRKWRERWQTKRAASEDSER